MFIRNKVFSKQKKEVVDMATASAIETKKLIKSELKQQLTELSDFAKTAPEMKKQQDELFNSLEKLAQSAKPIVK